VELVEEEREDDVGAPSRSLRQVEGEREVGEVGALLRVAVVRLVEGERGALSESQSSWV
jgi:hypothetical protein